MNNSHPTLAQSIRQILLVGLSASPFLAVPALAQNANTSANDAVVAAAEAARAAADAAKAAAEAAMVAAQAARAAVEAANGLSSAQRRNVDILASPDPVMAEALAEIEWRKQSQTDTGATVVATSAAPSQPSVLASAAMAAGNAMVFTRAEINASGQTQLSEFLRDLAVNTNGSFRQTSGSGAQAQSALDLAGIGSEATLVLINGERMAGSPTLNGGSTFNLNAIPMAAVKRVEVMGPGASAIYGDNAVGGVVNIVTEQAFDGFSVSGTVGRPTREGGDERAIAVTGGVRNARGQISFALDHTQQDIVINGDRDYSDLGLSSFGFPGSFFAAGPNGESLGTFPDPRCPTGDGSGEPPGVGEYPDSVVLGSRCRYNYVGVGATEAGLERNSLFVDGDFEVNDSVEAYARMIVTTNTATGRAAPTPQVGGSPFLPTMSAANPNNPTNPANVTNSDGDDLTPFHNLNGLTGPFDLSIFYRNVPGGFRDQIVDNTFIDLVGGLTASSDALGGVELDLVAQHSEQTSKGEFRGLALRDQLQAAIDDGSFDVFGVNGPTDPAVAAGFTYTGSQRNETARDSVRAQLTLDGVQAGSLSLPVYVGVQSAKETFKQNYDPLINAGTVDGFAASPDIAGDRQATSIFGGASLNFGRAVNLDYQARTDNYDLHGNVSSQRLGVALSPIPGFTLHASYSNGFVAPDLGELFLGTSQSFNSAIDVVRCAQAVPGAVSPDGTVTPPQGLPPNSPCLSTQYQNLIGGNPELDVESAESWTVGATVGGDGLSVALRAYEIEIDDQVGTLPLQQILANEFVNGGSEQVVRNPNGTISSVLRNNQNIAATRTRGVTVDAIAGAYRAGNGPGARLSAAYIDQLESQSSSTAAFGVTGGALQPNLRANLDMLWRFGNAMALTVNGNYIGEAATPDGSVSLDSWLTWDAQLEVAFPWDGSLAVGARNLFDEDPPLSLNLGNPNYVNSLHNPYGIVPYVRYSQEL